MCEHWFLNTQSTYHFLSKLFFHGINNIPYLYCTTVSIAFSLFLRTIAFSFKVSLSFGCLSSIFILEIHLRIWSEQCLNDILCTEWDCLVLISLFHLFISLYVKKIYAFFNYFNFCLISKFFLRMLNFYVLVTMHLVNLKNI